MKPLDQFFRGFPGDLNGDHVARWHHGSIFVDGHLGGSGVIGATFHDGLGQLRWHAKAQLHDHGFPSFGPAPA
ncbi:hypothetical protein [Paenarthrobacter sp. 4246]|uniref:hypothetical protein n=1 Tax=Paenarthrobacter sp. 4246 TaxID=3156456 RepID=UPI0033955D1D